jgi:hypothetical protein
MGTRAGTRSIRAAIAVLVFCLTAPLVSAGAAQDTQSQGITLHLLSQPPWHTPGDPLDLRIRIQNNTSEDLQGFRIQVAAHDRITSRSALHDSIQGSTGLDSALVTDDQGLEQVIPAGSSADIKLDFPVDNLLPLTDVVDGGVYPVSVRLYDASGFSLFSELTTHVLFYPSRPEVPLTTVPVLALNDLPSRGPSGRFEAVDGDAVPLEAALSEDGWLTGVVDGLSRWTVPEEKEITIDRPGRRPRTRTKIRILPALQLGLAPTPRFLEELADMSDGYVRAGGNGEERVAATAETALAADGALKALQQVVARPSIQTLLVPYANPDLPALTEQNSGLDAINHIDLGEDVVQNTLNVLAERTWLFPPAGRLDSPTLEDELKPADAARRTFVDQDSLSTVLDPEVIQCPDASPTFACAVRLSSGPDGTVAYVIDKGVDERFTELMREGDDRLDLQNLLAETAMVHAELPGTANRALNFVIPSTWHPAASTWRLFLRALARAPWMQTRRPDIALDRDLPVVDADLVARAPRINGTPDEEFFNAIADTAARIDHLQALGAPQDLGDRLTRNLLVAQSRQWWGDEDLMSRGTQYVASTLNEVNDHFSKVEVRGPQEITLTSRRGKIQLVVLNDGDFPVNVDVELRSVGAELQPDELSDLRIPEGTQRQLDINAVAQTSGIFTLDATVRTPDGWPIEEKTIRVRSTKFNLIALGLTVGALLFLILFYASRAFRRSGETAEQEAQG